MTDYTLGGFSIGIQYLGNDQKILVLPGAILSVDNNAGIQNNLNDIEQYETGCVAQILGSVISVNSVAVAFNAGPGNFGNFTLALGASGLVNSGSNYAAAVLTGSGNFVSNSGIITGGAGLWLQNWSNGEVFSDGDIIGLRFAGVKVLNSTAADIVNLGSIVGRGALNLPTRRRGS